MNKNTTYTCTEEHKKVCKHYNRNTGVFSCDCLDCKRFYPDLFEPGILGHDENVKKVGSSDT